MLHSTRFLGMCAGILKISPNCSGYSVCLFVCLFVCLLIYFCKTNVLNPKLDHFFPLNEFYICFICRLLCFAISDSDVNIPKNMRRYPTNKRKWLTFREDTTKKRDIIDVNLALWLEVVFKVVLKVNSVL